MAVKYSRYLIILPTVTTYPSTVEYRYDQLKQNVLEH